MLGSKYFTQSDPLIPLDKIVGVLNFDIQATNLIPSLRSNTLAVGAETGGPQMSNAVADAYLDSGLTGRIFSQILGQRRSDYQNFLDQNVPTVFFTDSNGPCYHTAGDEVKVVDFDKMEKQAKVGLKLTYHLASTTTPPEFTPISLIPITFNDIAVFRDVWNLFETDEALFTSDAGRELFYEIQKSLNNIVARGRIPLIGYLLFLADLPRLTPLFDDAIRFPLEHLECSGFLAND